jgi:hypothetical protein
MPLDEDVARRLTVALEDSTSWYDVHRQLRDLVPEGEEERHRALVTSIERDLFLRARATRQPHDL